MSSEVSVSPYALTSLIAGWVEPTGQPHPELPPAGADRQRHHAGNASYDNEQRDARKPGENRLVKHPAKADRRLPDVDAFPCKDVHVLISGT